MLKWLTNKTTWVGIGTIAVGVFNGATSGDWAPAIQTILLGIGMITGRMAIDKAIAKPTQITHSTTP